MEVKIEYWLVLEEEGIFSVYPTTDINIDVKQLNLKKIKCLRTEVITLTTEDLAILHQDEECEQR